MKKRIVSLFLVILMIVGVIPLWSAADESTLITTVTISLSEMAPQAGVSPYFPTLLAVNGDTALTDRITFYAEWYESTDDLRHSPDQYTELSTEAFVLDMYYNLYMGITAKYGNEIASDCQLIAILPDGSTLESLMFDYDSEYLFAGFDFLFDKTGLPVTTIVADGYALGSRGYDVTVAVESQVFDLPVGGNVPYALYYPNGDEVGVSVHEDYLNPETPYWLGLIVTNDTGDYSAYTNYDFVLDIPYTTSYIVKNVEYVEIYFQLEPLAYQSVERLDFELDGYYGGAALDQVTLGLAQDGFWPYSEYNDHFGFHYDGVDEPGTYITPSDAATLVFDNSETLWLWVNVLPLYETAFTPPPEVSLNIPYTECLMKGCDDGSLDIAFKLAPLQKPNDLEISISGYAAQEDVLNFEATVSGDGAEQSPGGYLDGYGIFADDNNEPGALLTQGTFAEETSYWAYVAMFPENGYDLSALNADDFVFDGFTPENAIGIYDQDSEIYYLYFKLPQIQLNAVNEMVTFYLEGYELGGEINQIQVYHSSGQIAMNDNYVAGYVILPEHDGKSDDLNFYQEGSFTADSTYWLGIAIRPAEGYSLRNARGEQFMLDVFDYSQVILDVVSSTEAYVYFKLPLAKVAHDIIFTFGGEDGVLFGYSVPDGTVIEEPAEPGQEGKV
ncbi:MAG: hypothetical protein IKU10_05695, partial [Clostridia bacterium]|nr:hypothetical protein [Clostridia bacterium]